MADSFNNRRRARFVGQFRCVRSRKIFHFNETNSQIVDAPFSVDKLGQKNGG